MRSEDLAGPDLASAKLAFPKSYLVGNTWVSGVGLDLVLTIDLGPAGIPLKIHHLLVAMQLSPDHGHATNGTIGGILDTEELIADFKQAAGAFSPDLCEGSTIDSIANQLRQASDIMADGSQDPAATCNGISIGLGFDAATVQLGPIAPPQPPPPDPCAPTP